MRFGSVFSVTLLFASAALFAPHAGADPRSRLLGEKGGTKMTSYAPILLEVDTQEACLAQKNKPRAASGVVELLPSRVYLWFHAPKKQWYFLLTDGYGLPPKDPIEFLRHGTVLPGALVGAVKAPGQKYVLEPDGKWRPTFRKEIVATWQFTNPQRLKFVEFGELAPTPTVAPEKK